MKHCPACKVDFADEFEDCFQCGAPLAAGAIEVPSESREREEEALAEEERRASRRMIELAKSLAIGLVAVVVLVVVLVIVTDDTVKMEKTWTLVHSDEEGRTLLGGPGKVTAEKVRLALQDETGFVLPEVVEGKSMLVYYPVASNVVFRKHMPAIVGVHRDAGGLVVHVRPSEEETPAAVRLLESMSRKMTRTLGPAKLRALRDMRRGVITGLGGEDARLPSYQIVPVVRLALTDEPVRFAVPRDLGGTEEEASLQEVSHSFVRDMTLGVFGSFLTLAIGGAVGFLLFFWILVKFS